MDGNFIDNSFDSLIESAEIVPEDYKILRDKLEKKHPLKYDKFALRIKFNQMLDPNSVNPGNAVLSSGNKPVNARVEYDSNRRSIIINPKSKYLRNTLYVLKLSGKVMSEGGRSLRENKFFIFKQNGTNLNFYKGFNGDTGVRAPDMLNIKRGFFLPVMFFVSALVLVGSYLLSSRTGLAVGTALVLIATGAAFIDSISDFGKSHREYIYGAKLYNNGYFFEAIECFEFALHLNPDNIYAKYGLDAAIIKCSKAVD